VDVGRGGKQGRHLPLPWILERKIKLKEGGSISKIKTKNLGCFSKNILLA
jgi:hypothetical protein